MKSDPRPFIEQSNWRGLWAVTRDWLAIASLIAFSEWAAHPLVTVGALWVIGLFQFALGESLLHEASHYNLFATRAWNTRLQFLFALPFFRTVAQFQSEHSVHHVHLAEPDDHVVKDYDFFGLHQAPPRFFWIWFIKPIVGFAAYFYLGALSLMPPREGLKVVSFWVAVLALAWWLGVIPQLALYWLVPMFWSYASFLYWSEIQDHYNTRGGTRTNVGWLNNLVTHNNGYHLVHHLYPRIPWYRLKEAHAALCPDATDISRGFLDTYRQISAPR